MYLTVAECMAACHDGQDGLGCGHFSRVPQPGDCNRYPWADLCGPLRRFPRAPAPRMRPGMPAGCPGWEPAFAHDFIRWEGALARHPGLRDVSWAEVALDNEAFIGWALPMSRHHNLGGMRLPLGERAKVLRRAAQLV